MKRPIILLAFYALLISFFSFPVLNPIYGAGLDSGYWWAINYLFDANKIDVLASLVYPIGPLGFLLNPLAIGNNFIIGALSLFLLSFIFYFFLLSLGYKVQKNNFPIHIVITFLISLFAIPDFLIAGSVLVLILLYKETARRELNLNSNSQISNWYLIFAFVLSAVGWFVKSSIGVICVSAIFSFLIVDSIIISISWLGANSHFSGSDFKHYFKKQIIRITIFAGCFLIVSLAVLKSPTSVLPYLFNSAKLVFGYSDALALYPENNWWLLSGFIMLLFAYPLLCRDKNLSYFFIIALFSLFAVWKHAISREDSGHYHLFIPFLIFFFGIATVYTSKFSIYNFIIPLFAIMAYILNGNKLPDYSPYYVEFGGINNLSKILFSYSKTIEKGRITSQNYLAPDVIDDSSRKIIGNATIDIYPWELSYVPANNFNWKPRTTLQSGAYNSWFDGKSARNFSLSNGPEYILFHPINDRWGGNLGSLDERYLLNDEPQTILTILNNYSLTVKNTSFVLYKKESKSKLQQPQIIHSDTTTWETWIPVPAVEDGILRAKIICKKKISGKMKSFLFKDESFFVEYKFADGKVFKYKFIPANAIDGIWVNPFIQDIHSNVIESPVAAVRFLYPGKKFYEKKITINWELNKVNTAGTSATRFVAANALFGKTITNPGYFIYSMNDFEKNYPAWSFNTSLDSIHNYEGKYSQLINKEGFSSGYKINLDTIFEKYPSSFIIETGAWFYLHDSAEANLVVSIERDKQNVFWRGVSFKEVAEGNNLWSFVYFRKTIDSSMKDAMLNIYVWNNGKKNIPVSVDNFYVKITGE